MLNILEKAQYVFSGLVITIVIVLYVWQGPVRQSKALVAPVKIEIVKPPVVRPPEKDNSKTRKAPAPPVVTQRDQELLNRLKKEQNVRGAKTVTRAVGKVSKGLLDYVTTGKNWFPELDKAAHQLLKGADGKKTRLKIFKIDEDSILNSKLGLQNNDIVEFIDGNRIDFENGTSPEYIGYMRDIEKKLRNGGSVSVTITRNGQPMQIDFKLH